MNYASLMGLKTVFSVSRKKKLLSISRTVLTYNHLKVDFHCRVIFTCVRTYTLTGFTCVNKLETMYGRSDVNVKVYARLFIHRLYFIYARKAS